MTDKQKAAVKETSELLEQGVKTFVTGENFQTYLEAVSKFHRYSINNCILIAMQCPTATHVAGFNTWKKTFKRNVKKGEHGIKIFAPCTGKHETEDENGERKVVSYTYFRVATVFDISQTEGEPLPECGVHELTDSAERYEELMEAIRHVAGIPVEFEDIKTGGNGYYTYASGERIAIREGMSQSQTLKTGVHELAHSRLHNEEAVKKEPKDKHTKEVEAESISFVVLHHFGIDTSDYSFGYVGGWSTGKELPELKASMQTIRDTAATLIDELEQAMQTVKAA